jgi:DNA-binding winged helix-turn-helix (wHTH) protein
MINTKHINNEYHFKIITVTNQQKPVTLAKNEIILLRRVMMRKYHHDITVNM